MSSLIILASLLAIFFISVYSYVRNAFSYWQRKGVPFLKPNFPFGNIANSFLQRVSLAEELKKFYDNSNEPVLGIYTTVKPTLLARDPKIIQDILIREFSSFDHRGMYFNEEIDPMAANILLQHGEKWKHMRSKLSPAFTPEKLKGW